MKLLRALRNHALVSEGRVRGELTKLSLLTIARCGARLSVGRGTRVEVYGDLVVGDDVVLADGCWIRVGPGATMTLGDGVFVGQGTVVEAQERLDIGARTLIAEHASVRDGDHHLDPSEREHETRLRTTPVRIGEHCWIAAGARVLRGAELGDGVVVAANSVVKAGAYAPRVVLAGTPASVVRTVDSSPSLDERS